MRIGGIKMNGYQRCHLPENRYFDPDPAQRSIAEELYQSAANLPIISPHGHVDPRLLADENASFGTPADLFIIPDHYVFRVLYSQGIRLEDLGIPRVDGGPVRGITARSGRSLPITSISFGARPLVPGWPTK